MNTINGSSYSNIEQSISDHDFSEIYGKHEFQMRKFDYELVFGKLRSMEQRVSIQEEEAKKIAIDLINVLREHDLTYGMACELLTLTDTILRAMSQTLSL